MKDKTKHIETNAQVKYKSKYDVMKLQGDDVKNRFNLELRNKISLLEAVPEEPRVETKWNLFVNTYKQTRLQRKELRTRRKKRKKERNKKKTCILGNKVEEWNQLKINSANSNMIKKGMKEDKRQWIDR